jgi:hypothetical protein
MRFEFSEPHQQYRYFLEVTEVRPFKHVSLSVKYQGAKYPDAVASKVEFFLNDKEWNNFKDAINSME